MSEAHVWHLPPANSSAEQHAAYLKKRTSSAERPVGKEQSFHRLAFYNVGWLDTDRKRNTETLAKLVSTICRKKNVHAFGICEVFNIEGNDTLRKEQIMNAILDRLNENSEGSDFWIGRTDVHYVFVWNSNALKLVHYNVISCGIPHQAYRQAQYFQFVTSSDGDTLHVFHNHSPSSVARKLTDGRRRRICSTFWHHVARNSSASRPRGPQSTRKLTKAGGA